MGSSAAGVDTANSNLSGTEFAVRLQCGTSGTVTSIFVKSANPVATRRCALYADNSGALTGASRLSADITPPVIASGWHQYTVSPGVAVTSGVFYWLAFLNTGGTYDYTDNAASGGTTRDTSGQTVMAATHATTTASFTNRFNAYADGTVAGGATAKQLAALGVG